MSLESVSLSSKVLLLKEHFNWIVWALAQFYFFFNGSSTHYQSLSGATEASESTTSTKRPCLPKVGSKTWSSGFEFKGLHVRVLPYEDAFFIRNELKALKYAQLELLELRQLCSDMEQDQIGLH